MESRRHRFSRIITDLVVISLMLIFFVFVSTVTQQVMAILCVYVPGRAWPTQVHFTEYIQCTVFSI